MKSKTYPALYLLVSLLLLFPMFLSAQLPKRVDGEGIKKIISLLASDEYQGRETGTKECTMAEDYFANECKKLKLLPAGDEGSYYYNYSLRDRKEGEKPTLIIDDRIFISGRGEDFNLTHGSDGGNAESEIVFAGYGIFSPEKKRNDFDSIDIRGKIVLIKHGAPRNDIAAWRPYSIDSVKADYCYKNGAAGVLFYEPADRTNAQIIIPFYNNTLARYSVLPGFPVFTVDERVVRFIFQKTNFSYWRISHTIDRQTSSFNTGKKCNISAKVSKPLNIKARNVLGMIPGSDPKLKNEYIIIGGHLDHIGVGQDGTVRNGADDNASGPSVALGIARAMVKNKFRPKRSIIFAAWTGEEKGLLGSKAWCEKPGIDLKKVVVYFNLDMVGLGDGNLDMPGTEFAPEVFEFIKKNADSTLLKHINWEKGGLGGSDHNYFLLHGVPAFAGMTSGSHPDYHQSGDDPDKIKAGILQLTGDFIYYCTEKIADSKEVFISENRFAENKIKLIEYSLLLPVLSTIYKKELENSSARLAIVDFSVLEKSSDPLENFLSLLRGFDSSLVSGKTEEKFILASSAYEAVYPKSDENSGLLASFNPDGIGLDETWFKVLAKYGYRLAAIDYKSSVLNDPSGLKKLMKLSGENGVGLILDKLSASSLETVLKSSDSPCMILSKDPNAYSDNLISLIKEGHHLVVYQLNKDAGMKNDLDTFEALKKKVGDEYIAISPGDLSESSSDYFKRFLLNFISVYPDEDYQNMIFSGNFIQFAAESLQIKQR
jgi:aminopeptidase YwaD